MAVSEVTSTLAQQDTRRRDLRTGVYIGVLAALLIASAVAVNRARDSAEGYATNANNLWTFFMQKEMRRTFFSIFSDNLKLTLAAQPDMPADVRQKFEATIQDYQKTIARLRSEPETGEGSEQLAERAKHSEQSRITEIKRRTQFEYARSLYQMSIVIAVTALISGSSLVLYLSCIPALFGFLMLLVASFSPHLLT
jgi:Domain of unknown function (DUF4337)